MEIISMNYLIRLILTIIIIIVLVYILLKFGVNRKSTKGSLDIMKERLEKGEITEEDYNRAKERQGKK